MIDKSWLEQLDFEAFCGRLKGLAGLGSQNVVFKYIADDGTKHVLKLRRNTLGLHINEIPPIMSDKPEYNVEHVNRKLTALVGNDKLDTMTTYYDLLYSKIMKVVSDRGMPGLIAYSMSRQSIETLPFIINTRPFLRRLKEIIEWPFDINDPLSLVPKINGPDYPIQLNLVAGPPNWAVKAKEAIQFLPEYNHELKANSL